MKNNAVLDISRYKNNTQETINDKFCGGCYRGDLDVVQFLLFESGLPYRPQLGYLKAKVFEAAVRHGGVEVYQYLEKFYTKKKMEIPHPDFRTVCSENAPGMVDYLTPKMKDKDIEEGMDFLMRNDRIDLINHLMSMREIELKDKYFKTAWGYAPNVLKWMLLNKKYAISGELDEWIKIQPITIMKSMASVLDVIQTLKNRENMDNILDTKEEKSSNRIKI